MLPCVATADQAASERTHKPTMTVFHIAASSPPKLSMKGDMTSQMARTKLNQLRPAARRGDVVRIRAKIAIIAPTITLFQVAEVRCEKPTTQGAITSQRPKRIFNPLADRA